MQKIVFSKLLGFCTLVSDEVDFSDDTFGAKLGAKVGDPEASGAPAKGIDFKDETLGARLGAKIGGEPD